MEYIPNPENTNDILLDKSLNELMEKMAKNTHENWAKQRISEGWTYAEKRDDKAKTHPCLIPYEDLPEQEKEYDRITSQETLKFIIKSGYKIEKEKE